jgi:predicted ester cyclase
VKTVKQVLDKNIAAVNAHDLVALLDIQSPDIKYVLPGGVTLQGRDEVAPYTQAAWTALWNAFPDAALSFGEQVLGEGVAASELVFTGTHRGPLQSPGGPIQPTGRRVTLHSASIHRIENGQITSETVYLDPLELGRQLGLTDESTTG